MADTTKTFQEALNEMQVTGSYIWRPNRFFVMEAGEYISADSTSDISTQEIADRVSAAGAEAIDEIEDLGNVKLNYLKTKEAQFQKLKTHTLQTYRRLYLFFYRYNIPELAEVLDTAISEVNAL